MATAGNANLELVAGRAREGGMATLNETLLGHSIRVTGPLLSRHRGRRRWLPSGIRPAFSRTERARAAGEVQTNSAAAAARQGSDVAAAAALPTHDDVLRVTVAVVRAQGSVRPSSRLRSAGHCPMIVTHSAAVGGDTVARSLPSLRPHLFLHRSGTIS